MVPNSNQLIPPPQSEHALNDSLDVDGEKRIFFYECRGMPEVMHASFLSSKPWCIAFNIAPLSHFEIRQLPQKICLYGLVFILAGYSLHTPGHFTSVLSWHGNLYHYDGMQSTKELRFAPLQSSHLHGKNGSHAYYFIVT